MTPEGRLSESDVNDDFFNVIVIKIWLGKLFLKRRGCSRVNCRRRDDVFVGMCLC